MRIVSIRSYLVFVCFAIISLWLLFYFVGVGRVQNLSRAGLSDVEEKLKVKEKITKTSFSWQLTNLVHDNQVLLEKLKVGILQHKNILLDKMRSEVSAQNALEAKQISHQEILAPHPTLIKTTSTLKTEPPDIQENVAEKIQNVKDDNDEFMIPIMITACNRPSVSRCLDKLFSVRGSQVDNFPIIVSQDCGDKATADVLNGYGDKITFVKHDPEPVPQGVKSNLVGYYKIASHYKFAINQAFHHFPSADSIIILEDDIEIAPDFLSYFKEMHELMKKDQTLWCASAWNDNGKTSQVDATEKGAELLYRTDFFPGLGWLLKRSLWEEELVSKWPQAFWDDWMREPEQRKGRSCIRPEVSRTSTFGRKGVSAGQFFDTHLKYIKLNEFPVDWSTKDLSYLVKDNYDKSFKDKVYNLPLFRISDLKENKDPDTREVRIEYTMSHTFKAFAKELGLMSDFKKGVPRTAYMGIVTTIFRGRRVYLAPPVDWTGYVESWS
uniref:alpha-1,3-mannosyl-glycoprotein 2-beta-N-acetylglucosaminyltransferase-like isoform X1 n=1 Tax=Styela clava TaxID=7725 RepID=UPI00193A4123|nr:alpha-1,3-mannosyl-glycoprotein 2-beta-N-acetylglucosaminyltransferase-like isoform X1 [Styela clava]